MSRLFLGNFDFEIQLAARDQRVLPKSIAQALSELSLSWVAVAEEGDFVWCPDVVDSAFLDELHAAGLPRISVVHDPSQVSPKLNAVPWGWTPAVLRWAKSLQASTDSPSMDVVRRLNSRMFSVEMEQALGVGLPGQATISTLDELMSAIQALESQGWRWVVKTEFSSAGREQFRQPADSAALKRKLNPWAVRRLATGQYLFVEPWVERLAEAGIQLTVVPDGPPRLEGVTALICDAMGGYRGSEFTPGVEQDAVWGSALDAALAVATVARDAGYFGPLGIDAMLYRDEHGQERVRPIQDVNARWTMGRLSLGLRRLLQPGERGVWLTDGKAIPKSEGAVQLSDRRVISLSPPASRERGGRGRSLVVIDRAERFQFG